MICYGVTILSAAAFGIDLTERDVKYIFLHHICSDT